MCVSAVLCVWCCCLDQSADPHIPPSSTAGTRNRPRTSISKDEVTGRQHLHLHLFVPLTWPHVVRESDKMNISRWMRQSRPSGWTGARLSLSLCISISLLTQTSACWLREETKVTHRRLRPFPLAHKEAVHASDVMCGVRTRKAVKGD